MFDPGFRKVTFDDIDAMFKSKPENFTVHEERKDGKFKSYTVTT